MLSLLSLFPVLKTLFSPVCNEKYPQQQQETSKLSGEANSGTESRKDAVETAEKTKKLQRKMPYISDS